MKTSLKNQRRGENIYPKQLSTAVKLQSNQIFGPCSNYQKASSKNLQGVVLVLLPELPVRK